MNAFVLEEKLLSQIKGDKLSHAYMFLLPNGVGKSDFAEDFSKALLCEDKERLTFEECGECKSCLMLREYGHPDYILFDSAGDGIKIDDIRGIIKSAYIKPVHSKKKIFYIKDAHLMNTRAQNAFLKVLEEPPKDVMFILTVKNKNLLLETIKSRVALFEVSYDSQDDIVEDIVEEFEFSDVVADIIFKYSAGNREKAFSLAEKEDFLNIREKAIDYAFNANKDIYLSYSSRTSFLKPIIDARDKKSMELIFDVMQSVFRDMLVCSYGGYDRIINVDRVDRYKQEASEFSKWELQKLIQIVEDARYALSVNVNYNTAIETMFVKLKEGVI